MRIKTRGHVWIVTVVVTMLACMVATTAIYTLSPTAEWPQKLAFIMALTIVTIGPVTFFIGNKLRENRLLRRELGRLIDRDRLTNVATRDYFFDKIDQTRSSFGTVLLVDIDHFKRINDAFGHLAGDQVIQDVARALQNQVRFNDVVCRFDGVEFLVFLFGMTTVDGHVVAERMRGAIARQRSYRKGAEMRVTVSIGGALKEPLQDADSAVHKAHAALFRAKVAGRNRVKFELDMPAVMAGRA